MKPNRNHEFPVKKDQTDVTDATESSTMERSDPAERVVALFMCSTTTQDRESEDAIVYAGQPVRSCMDAEIQKAMYVCVPLPVKSGQSLTHRVYSVCFVRILRPRGPSQVPLFEFSKTGVISPRPGLLPEYLNMLKPKTRTLVAHGLFSQSMNGGIVRCTRLRGNEIPSSSDLKGQLRDSVLFELAMQMPAPIGTTQETSGNENKLVRALMRAIDILQGHLAHMVRENESLRQEIACLRCVASAHSTSS